MNKPIAHKSLKLVAIGNSTGVILPRELLARLRVDRGDTLSLVEGQDGFELRVADPDFDEEMAAVRVVMERRRKALRELAK
jgi:putative addiction module antidote